MSTIIYIRSSGNDGTGNGSIGSPYLTANKGFQVAYENTGEYILDFGSGNFGGVYILGANATEWPSRIRLRGINTSQSLLDGINANGLDQGWDYETNTEISPSSPGCAVNIISDLTINLGNIISNGGGGDYSSSNGGNITLTNCYCSGIYSNGGSSAFNAGGGGGTIQLINSQAVSINSDGGGGDAGGGGGSITIGNSNVLSVNATGGLSSASLYPGGLGTVFLSGISTIPPTINAGSINLSNLKKGYGINKSDILGLN